jgi:Cys-tRNA(Pro)/Cys-tRNA(Cys) deacylase
MPPDATFKTLVARGDKTGVVMACLPGDSELDLKKFAAVTGNKKVELVAVKEIQTLTGYIRGGVSPLGTKKKYPLYLDEMALMHDRVSVSAGQRGLQMILAPQDLQQASQAQFADITKPLSA